jgi:hypothetical protein
MRLFALLASNLLSQLCSAATSGLVPLVRSIVIIASSWGHSFYFSCYSASFKYNGLNSPYSIDVRKICWILFGKDKHSVEFKRFLFSLKC